MSFVLPHNPDIHAYTPRKDNVCADLCCVILGFMAIAFIIIKISVSV